MKNFLFHCSLPELVKTTTKKFIKKQWKTCVRLKWIDFSWCDKNTRRYLHALSSQNQMNYKFIYESCNSLLVLSYLYAFRFIYVYCMLYLVLFYTHRMRTIMFVISKEFDLDTWTTYNVNRILQTTQTMCIVPYIFHIKATTTTKYAFSNCFELISIVELTRSKHIIWIICISWL